ncbi:MAG: hypothetical protein Q4A75_08105 [Peptostreptococcaceae bacterium]|nr:hypothetical protein [Peptostreptococcaceae bacterium]
MFRKRERILRDRGALDPVMQDGARSLWEIISGKVRPAKPFGACQ